MGHLGQELSLCLVSGYGFQLCLLRLIAGAAKLVHSAFQIIVFR